MNEKLAADLMDVTNRLTVVVRAIDCGQRIDRPWNTRRLLRRVNTAVQALELATELAIEMARRNAEPTAIPVSGTPARQTFCRVGESYIAERDVQSAIASGIKTATEQL